jgi:hypothetical protein
VLLFSMDMGGSSAQRAWVDVLWWDWVIIITMEYGSLTDFYFPVDWRLSLVTAALQIGGDTY